MDSPFTQTTVDPDVFNFGVGQPGPDLLEKAFAMIKEASRGAFDRGDPFLMQYGIEAGSTAFRRELAEFYNEHAKASAHEDEVFATTGVSGALQLLGTVLASPGDCVVVEQPTYFLARDVFGSVGLATLPAPMLADGTMDLEGLAAQIAKQREQGRDVKLLYVVPVHSNPTSRNMSAQQKQEYIDFAEAQGLTIVADEVYELLNFGKRSVESPPFRELCGGGGDHVISLNSFSKICAPGLRCGWVLASKEVVKKVAASGVLSSGGGMNPVMTATMAEALRSGRMQDLLVNEVQPNLSAKAKSLCEAINKHLCDDEIACTFLAPEGGYFIFLKFPEWLNTTELLPIASDKFKVKYTPGERCLGGTNTARVSFAFYSAEEMEEGVLRLRQAILHYKRTHAA